MKQADPARKVVRAAIVALFGGCGLLWLPRPVEPRSMPPLTLDRKEVAQVVALDRARAAARHHSRAAELVYQGVLDHGRAEAEGAGDLAQGKRLHARLKGMAQRLARDIGEEGMQGWRSYAVEQFVQAAAGKLDADLARAVLGRFPELMERYGFVRDGRRVAPELCIRAAYKVRYNLILGLPERSGLADVETRAFEGWIALRDGTGVPLSRRQRALARYRQAGGESAREAMAILHWRAGSYPAAQRTLYALYRETGAVRFRNYALAARARARQR